MWLDVGSGSPGVSEIVVFNTSLSNRILKPPFSVSTPSQMPHSEPTTPVSVGDRITFVSFGHLICVH